MAFSVLIPQRAAKHRHVFIDIVLIEAHVD